MSFDPSTNCIVTTYYSGSVNLASTNSQSVVVIPQPIIEKRFWQHFDLVFRVPGLTDIISIYEQLTALRRKLVTITESAISVSDSQLRKSIHSFVESILLTGKVRTNDGLGSGSYVQLNSIQLFVSQISITAWVKFINADNNGYGGIVGLINGWFGNRLLLNEYAQTILFEIDTTVSSTVSCSYTLPDTVFSNQWHHFAATWDGVNMKLYYDGSVVGSPVPLTGAMLSGNLKTSIGMGAQNQFFLHGNIAELALYNTALTPTQISNVYNNGTNTVTTGQVAYYKLNEGSGNVVKNSAGSINGILVNGPVWSTDLHSAVPNRSIYSGFISDSISRLKSLTRTISDTISVSETSSRLPKPFLRESTFIIELLSRLFKPLTTPETTNITEGSGFTSGFSGGFNQIPGLLRDVIPKIVIQSASISESLSIIFRITRTFIETTSIIDSQLRKIIPKIPTEISSITETKVIEIVRKISQTTTISESQLRKFIPKLATEVKSISESLLRKPMPSIATQSTTITESKLIEIIRNISQSTTISESLSRVGKHFRTIAESTISVIETQLRMVIPKLSTQTAIMISDSLLRKPIPKIITETTSIVESKLRKVIRPVVIETSSISDRVARTAKHFINIATQVISVIETQLRKPVPKITTQSASISDSIAFIKGRFLSLLETVTSTESLSRLAKHFRTRTETTSITDTNSYKKVFKFASDTVSITETKIRKFIPRLQDQLIVPISDSLRRRISRALPDTSSVSELLSVRRLFIRSLTETGISIVQALRRTVIRPQSDTTSISESIPRKILRKIGLQSTSVSDTVSKLRNVPRSIAETISVTELTIKRALTRLISQTTNIVETQTRRPKPLISTQSISTSDSITKKATKLMTDIITIIETQLRKPIPKITTQSTIISDSQLRRAKPFISETITVIEARIRKLIPKIPVEAASITESKVIRTSRVISQITSIVEIQLRRIIRPVSGAVVISDTVQALSHSIKKVLTETISITETRLRRPIPKITTQSVSISDFITKLRMVPRTINQTTTISESLRGAHQVLRIIIESPISIAESRLRTFIPRISTQTTRLLDTLFYNSIHAVGLLFVFSITEFVDKIEDRLEAGTAGPSFRWRFNPFRKSSFTNRFTPKRSGNR